MKKMIPLFYVCLVLLGIFLALSLASAFPQENLDPIKVAPDTHKLVFENKFVRVIEAKVPVGGMEPKHSHPHGVTVYVADYDVEMKTFPDGNVTKAHRQFGTVSWSEAVVHEVRNVGRTPSHAVRVELKY
ncbi:MAG TPA: hypothetical protein VGL91_25640 [Acidobacteriota bacterium]|jgi:hypothetical protein